MTDLLRVVLAILATYRLAELLVWNDGPFDALKRFRAWARMNENETIRGSLGGALSCEYCVGFWIALVMVPLVLVPSLVGDIVLVLFGVAGGQSVLAYWTGNEVWQQNKPEQPQ